MKLESLEYTAGKMGIGYTLHETATKKKLYDLLTNTLNEVFTICATYEETYDYLSAFSCADLLLAGFSPDEGYYKYHKSRKIWEWLNANEEYDETFDMREVEVDYNLCTEVDGVEYPDRIVLTENYED